MHILSKLPAFTRGHFRRDQIHDPINHVVPFAFTSYVDFIGTFRRLLSCSLAAILAKDEWSSTSYIILIIKFTHHSDPVSDHQPVQYFRLRSEQRRVGTECVTTV